MNNVLIGNQTYPANGWAVIFAGGSASGKSTLIRNGRMLFKGETLSTDTLGENIIEVHNNAARYAKENPELLAEAEKLVAAGMQTRFPETNVLNKVQNVHLDFNAITVTSGKVSTILSNGAHAQKGLFFRKRIKANAEDGMKNILLDITGNEKDVTGYTDYLKSFGYKVAIVWVITNRSIALLWNHLRPRAMKVGAVHTGHDNPNRYLLDALQDGRLAGVDDAWLVFNSSDAIGKEMSEEEKAQSAVQLQKKDDRFAVAPQLAERVRRTLGPNPPSKDNKDVESAKYVSASWMKKTFERIRMVQKMARDNNITIPQITDFIVSFLDSDKSDMESRLKDFYKSHGITEPKLLPSPMEVYDVNQPVREQFLGKNGEAKYQEAVCLYPEQKAAYNKAVKEWNEYNKQFS